MRLWNRAIEVLTRLIHTSKATAKTRVSSPNPFQVSPLIPADAHHESPEPSNPVWDLLVDGLHWRLLGSLASTLFDLGHIHYVRGSVKASEFFLTKVKTLVTGLNAPILLSRALVNEAKREIAVGEFAVGQELLMHARYTWEQVCNLTGR